MIFYASTQHPDSDTRRRANALARLFAPAHPFPDAQEEAEANFGYTPHGAPHAVLLSSGVVRVVVHSMDVRTFAPYVQAARALGHEVELHIRPVTFVEWLCRMHRPFWVDDEELPEGVNDLPGNHEGTWERYPGSQLPDLLNGDAYASFAWTSAPTDACAAERVDRGGDHYTIRCNGACRVYAPATTEDPAGAAQ